MALNGTQALIGRLRAASERAKAAAARGLNEAGEQIFADSQELCPVSPTNEFLDGTEGGRIDGSGRLKNPIYLGTSGSLAQSGVDEEVVMTTTVIYKRIKYTAEYAAAVHEVPDAKHGAALASKYPLANIPNLQGRWKFLAIPILLRERWAMQHIASRIAGVLNG